MFTRHKRLWRMSLMSRYKSFNHEHGRRQDESFATPIRARQRGRMNADSVEQLISFLENIASETQENSSKLAALDRTLAQHDGVNSQYRESMGRLRFSPATRSYRQRTVEALQLLRQALLRDQPPSPTAVTVQARRIRPRPNRRLVKKHPRATTVLR